MDRSVRFFVFALLIVTTGARAVAQSHQQGAAARKDESHATPASTKGCRMGSWVRKGDAACGSCVSKGDAARGSGVGKGDAARGSGSQERIAARCSGTQERGAAGTGSCRHRSGCGRRPGRCPGATPAGAPASTRSSGASSRGEALVARVAGAGGACNPGVARSAGVSALLGRPPRNHSSLVLRQARCRPTFGRPRRRRAEPALVEQAVRQARLTPRRIAVPRPRLSRRDALLFDCSPACV